MEPRSNRLAIGWATAWIALAILLAVIVGPWTALYSSRGIELPWITVVATSVGETLHGPFGWLALGALLAIGLLPLHLGVGEKDHRRWLLLGIAQALLAALLLWAVLELPLARLLVTWNTQADADRAAEAARRFRQPLQFLGWSTMVAAPAFLAATLLQFITWIPIALRVLGLPRVELRQEALRAIVVAILPGLVLAYGAYELADGWRTTPSTGLLVSPPLAAAGTAMLAAYGVALWLRMQGPSA